MPNFEYTYASWDHLRPGTMPKTGLGDALKKYEAMKALVEKSRIDCVGHHQNAIRALGVVETIRAKIVKDYGKNLVFKKAVGVLAAAPIVAEKQHLAAMLGHHIQETLGDFPEEARKQKTLLERRVELLEEALEDYKHGREHSAQVELSLKQNVGKGATVVGNPTISGQNELRAFLGGKSVYRPLLPDLVRECEDVTKTLADLQALSAQVNTLVTELKPKYKEK